MTIETSEGKITASEDVLNFLSIVFLDANMFRTFQGQHVTAEQYRLVSREIYDALRSVGYYDSFGVWT